MIRKIILMLVLPLAGAVTFYACKCQKELGNYLRPMILYVEPGDNQTTGYYRFTGDTLRFNANLSSQCISQNQTLGNPFVTQAFATTPQRCPCGEQGFKAGLTGFNVTTVGAYSTYADGADVSNLFACYAESYNSQTGQTQYTYYPINQAIQQFQQNIWYEEGFSNAKLFLTQKPGDTLSHKFVFTLTTQDTTLSYTGDSFKWM